MQASLKIIARNKAIFHSILFPYLLLYEKIRPLLCGVLDKWLTTKASTDTVSVKTALSLVLSDYANNTSAEKQVANTVDVCFGNRNKRWSCQSKVYP